MKYALLLRSRICAWVQHQEHISLLAKEVDNNKALLQGNIFPHIIRCFLDAVLMVPSLCLCSHFSKINPPHFLMCILYDMFLTYYHIVLPRSGNQATKRTRKQRKEMRKDGKMEMKQKREPGRSSINLSFLFLIQK